MKKRVLSVILALCMCISLLPTTARAVEATSYQLYVGSVEVTSSNAENITDDGKVSYDPETNTLTLNNATIEGGEYGIKYNGGNTLNIVGVGNNTVTGNDYGIWATGAGSSLSISGTVTAAASGANTTRGICASNSVTILGDATNVTATSGSGGFDNHGICANYVNIEGGTVSATGELYGIIANMNLAISGGTVTASALGEFGYALEAAYDITISGGTITADGDDYGIHADGSITISGGTVEMIGGDKAIALHPDLSSYEGGCTVTVRQNESDTAEWGSDDLTTYKYVKISAEGEGAGEEHSHYNCGVKGCTNGNHGHNEVTEWTKLTKANLNEGSLTLEDGKSYYLGEDITVTSCVEISGTVNLCLNGHSLTSAYEDGTVFIGDNATLNVTDCKTDGKIKNTGSGNAIVTRPFGENITLNLYKGTLESGAARAYYNGDACANCIFNQYGGKVTSAATETVAVMNGCGKYNLYGGSVENTNQNGRTVYVAEDSTQLSISGTVQLNKFIWVTNPIVIAGAITQPAGAYVVKYKSGGIGTFTSGWKTYMASADYTKYFTPNNAAYTITKDGDGELMLTRVGATTYTVTVTTDGKGSALASPATAAAGTEITLTATADSGYHFKEWQVISGTISVSNNKFTMPASNVTVKAIFEADAPVTPPTTYTVTFNANGGSGTMNAATGISGDYTLPACTFTAPAGKQFKAWSVGSEEKAAGAVIAVSADITVTALWEDISYSITGSVTDTSAGTAAVKLMQGNTEVKTATVTLTSSDTNYTGPYTFIGVAPGVYNIVAEKDGVTMTILITVTNANITNGDITMPNGNVNSKLEVKDEDGVVTPDVVVDGLQEEAEAVKTANGEATEVTVTMTVQAEAPDNSSAEHAAIKAVADSGATIDFLDISVIKEVVGGSNAGTSSISETRTVMEIVVPYDFTGKYRVTVYRQHGSEAAKALTKLTDKPDSPADGFFWMDETNGNIHIYAKKFSTYAIGYTVSSPNPNPNPNPNPQPPVYVPTVHSCVSKCEICGGCTDADCAEKTCIVKCKLLTMDFADVTEALWCYDEVVYVYHNSLMQGYGENEFYPDGTVTRQQVWMILARMSGADPKSMTAARLWAVENGVSDGTNPTAYVTRQQFVAMLWRYAKLQDWDVSVGEDTNILSYNDAFDVAEYAISAMQWACGSGLMNGKDGNLMPAANTTRGQMAAMFQRFCEDVKK